MFGTRTDRISKAPITLVWVLPVMLAEDPLTCVARGAGRTLEQFDRFKQVLLD